MKDRIKNFLILTVFLIGILSPVFAHEYQFDDPFENIKQEISLHHKILTFETRRINATYPSSKIDIVGMNYPGFRGPGQLVVYFPDFSKTTGTNEFGTEAVIEDDTVVKLTGANSVIPKNGFVISGHGSSKNWIKNNLKIGTKVIIEGNTLIAYTTPESYIFQAKEKLKDAEGFVNNSKKISNKSQTDRRAEAYLKKAKDQLKKAEKSGDNYEKEYAKSSIQFSKLAINYALPYIEDEFKGVWIRPTETNIYEIRKTLDAIKKTGIKEVFLETYFHGLTIYPSSVMKKYNLTAQNPKFLGFDPLKIYIDEAHKRGMKIHCWFESYYIGNKNPGLDYMSILSQYPAWGNKNLANYNSKSFVSHKTEHNGYFLDPSNSEVKEFLLSLIDELSSKYKIDGINLDYTRYPTSNKSTVKNYEQSNWGYTENARKEFMELYEVDPIEIEPDSELWRKWSQYRQDKIYEYVKGVNLILSGKNILLSAVIFPDYDVCLETKQQDWAKWSRDNLVDAVTPLILTADNELFESILKEVKSKTSSKTKVLTGLFVGFLDAEPEDLLRQINVARAHKSQGIVLFDWAHLPSKYQNVLKYRVFLPQK